MELSSQLKTLLRDQPGWNPGDVLARLAVKPNALQDLKVRVRRTLIGRLSDLPAHERMAFGASLVILGVIAFKEDGCRPYEWEPVGEFIGFRNLSRALKHDHRNAMEQGAADYLQIEILRSRTSNRKFIGTLQLHSGANQTTYITVAKAVGRRWSWDAIGRSSLSEVADWLEGLLGSPTFCASITRGTYTRLSSEEALYETAERMKQFADCREVVLRRGWQRQTVDETVRAIRTDGIDPTRFFALSTDAAVHELMAYLLNLEGASQGAEVDLVRWQWRSSVQGLSGPALRLPKRIEVDVPPEADRLLLTLGGLEPGTPPLYRRDGTTFAHQRGPLWLFPKWQEPVTVYARYRTGAVEREVIVGSVPLQDSVVATFLAESGNLVRTVPSGTDVYLVPRPTYSFYDKDKELSIGSTVQAIRMTVLGQPCDIALDGPSGRTTWTLHATERRTTLEIREGRPVTGLRMQRRQVLRAWPTLWSDQPMPGATYTVTAPGFTQEGRVRNRVGRLVLLGFTPPTRPGMYAVRIRSGAVRGSAVFFLAPQTAEATVEYDANGTRAALNLGGPCSLTHPDAKGRGSGWLRFPAERTGPVDVLVSTRHGDGVWRVTAAATKLTVIDADGSPATDPEYALLCGAGGIQIGGPPGAKVRIREQRTRRVWERRIGPDGRRTFHFSSLPASLVQDNDNALYFEVEWVGLHRHETLRFANEASRRPRIVVRESEIRLLLKRGQFRKVHMAVVRASRPWEGVEFEPAAVAEWVNDDKWFGAAFTSEPEPLQVCLYDQDRRITGVALAHGDSPPPADLTGLELALWQYGRGKPNREADRQIVEGLARHLGGETSSDEACALLESICKTVLTFGVRWFRIDDAIARVATPHRLLLLLRGQYDAALLQVFDELEVPWIFTRYGDLAFAFDNLNRERWSAAAIEVAGATAGLAFAVGSVVSGEIDDPSVFGKRAFRIAAPPLLESRSLAADELSLLKDSVEQFDADDHLDRHPRVVGLLQARLIERMLVDDQKMGALVRSVPAPDEPAVSSALKWTTNRRIPRFTQQIERAVLCDSWRLHRWRKGWPLDDDTRARLTRLEPYVPRLLDYWLNHWSFFDGIEDFHG